MAIVIEEQKKGFNWFALAIVILVVAGGVAASYYLFFAPTPFIEKVAPPRLESLKTVSQIELSPELITGNPMFQILKQYINPIEVPTGISRSNPFLP